MNPTPLQPSPLNNTLSAADRAAMAALRTRRALERSVFGNERRADADALCNALCHGQPVRPAAADGRDFIRVATWNIQRGIELDGMLELLRTHPLLASVDVLMLNEVDLGMARSRNLDVAAELGEALGFGWVFGNSYVCLDQGDVRDAQGLPSDAENTVGLHGNAILSRFPFIAAQNLSISITRDKFQSRTEKRLGHKKALLATVQTPWGPLRFASTHLDPIGTPKQRAAQLADVMAVLDGTSDTPIVARLPLDAASTANSAEPLPVLLGGDLNTSTYDLGSIPRLLWNLTQKAVRGGFPHAIHHYMHPWLCYERPVFDVLARHGFVTDGFNDLAEGTIRYEVGSFDSESKVRDMLPGFAVSFLRWRLAPWNGVAPLKVDWFAGRGLRALGAGERSDVRGPSIAPTVIVKPLVAGRTLSDHFPVLVDLAR